MKPMPMASMIRLLSASLLLAAIAQPALAATLTNSDSTPVELQITEPRGRTDIAVEPGTTEDICPAGCFVTMPNGDRVGLSGGETIEIKGGTARIK